MTFLGKIEIEPLIFSLLQIWDSHKISAIKTLSLSNKLSKLYSKPIK